MQENIQSSDSPESQADIHAAPGFVGYERDIQDHSSLDDLVVFVGDGFDKHYKARFSKLNDNKGSYVADWHWMGFLLPLPWLIYRKMYLFAIVYFAVLFLVNFFTGYAAYVAPAIHVVTGLLATFLYYNHAIQSITSVKGTGDERQNNIKSKGGHLGIVIVAGICVLLVAASASITYYLKVTQNAGQASQSLSGSKDSVNQKFAAGLAKSRQGIDKGIKAKWKAKGKSRLPAAVEELQQEYGLPAELFVDDWKTVIEYWPTRKGYSLRSAGPDTEFATDDDLFIDSTLD